MSRFFRVVASERLKIGRPSIWLLLSVSPLLAILIGIFVNLDSPEATGGSAWGTLFVAMSMLHAVMLMPVLAGILSAWVCRYEHAGGGWKQLLALPVTRTTVYAAKLTVVVGLIGICQLMLLGALWLVGMYQGLSDPFPWSMVLTSLTGSWFACFPVAALQLGASLAWSSFGIPLAINVSFTVPNLLILNSAKIAPFYPWAQPVLAMLPDTQTMASTVLPPMVSLIFTVTGSFIAFVTAGLIYFVKKEI
jgi:hypothetical protein